MKEITEMQQCRFIRFKIGDILYRGTDHPVENLYNNVLWLAFDTNSAGIYTNDKKNFKVYSYRVLDEFMIFDMSDLYTRNYIIRLSGNNEHCKEVFPTYYHKGIEYTGRESEFYPDTKCLEKIREKLDKLQRQFSDSSELQRIIGIGSDKELRLSYGGKGHHPEMALFNNFSISLSSYLEVVDAPSMNKIEFMSPTVQMSPPPKSKKRGAYDSPQGSPIRRKFQSPTSRQLF
jgi:hypothetical protein